MTVAPSPESQVAFVSRLLALFPMLQHILRMSQFINRQPSVLLRSPTSVPHKVALPSTTTLLSYDFLDFVLLLPVNQHGRMTLSGVFSVSTSSCVALEPGDMEHRVQRRQTVGQLQSIGRGANALSNSKGSNPTSIQLTRTLQCQELCR